jgi:ribosomal protein L37AE/L43A
MTDSTDATSHPLTCPFCEVYELRPFGHNSLRCESCGGVLSGVLLETLSQIARLPDAIGRHACECGHPEMRRLPDDVYWCPACGSEVLPVTAPPVAWKSADRSEAYWAGWLDGRYRDIATITKNPRLSSLDKFHDRLDYYRGHRDGRNARVESGRFLEAA